MMRKVLLKGLMGHYIWQRIRGAIVLWQQRFNQVLLQTFGVVELSADVCIKEI